MSERGTIVMDLHQAVYAGGLGVLSETLQVNLPPAMKTQFKTKCAGQRVSMRVVTTALVQAYIDEQIRFVRPAKDEDDFEVSD